MIRKSEDGTKVSEDFSDIFKYKLNYQILMIPFYKKNKFNKFENTKNEKALNF